MKECTCRAGVAQNAEPESQPRLESSSEQLLPLLAELLKTSQQTLSVARAILEQNEQLISIVIQRPEDDVVTGFGLDGLAIHVR